MTRGEHPSYGGPVVLLARPGRVLHAVGDRMGLTACGERCSVFSVACLGALFDHASGWCPTCWPDGLPSD